MAKIVNELSVAQGFGSLQKVFNMKAGEAILHGMLCKLDTGELAKGFTGTGMAFVAQNDYNNTDAQNVAADYTFIGETAGKSQITAIPVVAACEVEIPTARFETAPAIGDELIASATAGKWVTNPASATATVVGTVVGETADGFLVLLEKTVRYHA